MSFYNEKKKVLQQREEEEKIKGERGEKLQNQNEIKEAEKTAGAEGQQKEILHRQEKKRFLLILQR